MCRHLEIEDIGDVTIVNFTDKMILDDEYIRTIGDALFSLVDDLNRHKLILNFLHVEYLSSAALGKFITLNQKVNARGGRLVLCNIDPQIYELFEITKLNMLFNIKKDGDSDEMLGGVLCRLIPPKPSRGGSVALQPPAPEQD